MFTTYVHNLRATYYEATPEQVYAGLNWYPRATRLAREVAEQTGAGFHQVAGVIAALSPRCSWEFQERFTLRYVTHYLQYREPLLAPHPGTNTNKYKAARILDGADPLTVLGGEKVRAFYLNISLLNCDVPTLDIWAVRAACGDPTMNTNRYMQLTRGSRRADLVAAYHQLAKEVGIRVDHCQAICWVAYREKITKKGTADE